MKNNWWKILAVLLVIYSITVGMLVPLKPGITQCNTANGGSSVKTGENITLSVKGYNSFYQESGDVRAWLKLDSARLMVASDIQVVNDRELALNFALPAHLPINKKVHPLTLILDNSIDGTSVLPSAILVTQNEIDVQKGETAWENADIDNLHELKTMSYPFRNILSETIRNLFFHVPLWFGMFIIFTAAVVQSILYLVKKDLDRDRKARALTSVGILYGILGLVTGAIWAKHTWGAYWNFDIKQNMSAILMLIYAAYFVLRNSLEDEEKQARVGGVYNIFAFATIIPLLFVIPRLVDSLHPGNGGNPGFGGEDLDNTMRMIFYPGIIGWTLLGIWMAQVKLRMSRLEDKLLDI
ncbi:MAG: heme exporter protein C [Paraglaciecola sp.]|jgi:heme exporter protein C